MSYLAAPLQVAAGTITGSLLTAGAMLVGDRTGVKFAGAIDRSVLSPPRVTATIAAAVLVINISENLQAASPFYMGMELAVKVTAIALSSFVGAVFGLSTSPPRSISDAAVAGAVFGVLISTITGIFLAVMTFSIHPMVGPVIAGITSFASGHITGLIIEDL